MKKLKITSLVWTIVGISFFLSSYLIPKEETFFSCKTDSVNHDTEEGVNGKSDTILDETLIDSFLSYIQEIASLSHPKDINGNNLIELKDGKIDKSRMLFVHHYTYDWDLVKSSEVIDMDKVVIPNNNALTIIFFKTDLKKEVVGFAYGNRYNNGNWTATLGMPGYLHSEVDRLTYYLNKVKGDELIGIDLGKTFFGAKKDKGLYFEDRKYTKKGVSARMKSGGEVEDEVIKYDKDAIRKMLENRMRKFK